MSFISDKQFETITNKIPDMTDQELDNWEKDNSFTSYRTVLEQANEEWKSIVSYEDKTKFLKKYEDILSLQDSTITPFISIFLYQSIVNREGIYETNGFLNRVIGEYIVTMEKKDSQKLRSLKAIDIDWNEGRVLDEKNGMRIFKFIGFDSNTNARTNSTCTTYMQAEYYYNPSGCRNDRKAYISAKSYLTLSTKSDGDWRQPRVEILVWGKIRNGWCNWDSYLTLLEYRSVSFEIMAWSNQNGVSIPTLFSRILPDYAPTYEKSTLPWDQAIGDPLLNQLINPSAFNRLHAEGKSRGVDYNWAIIDCR